MKKKTIKKTRFAAILILIFSSMFPFYNFLWSENAEAANFLNDNTSGWVNTPTFNYPPDDARIGHSAVYSNYGENNEMIIFGGQGNTGTYNDVWILDLKSNSWREIIPTSGDTPDPPPVEPPCYDEDFNEVDCPSPLPNPPTGPAKRLEHSAAYNLAADTMYIFGGWQINSSVFRDLWALQNLHTNPVWKKLPPISESELPWGVRGSSAVWAENKLIIFGGVRDDARVSGKTIKYTPTTENYSYVANNSIARYNHSAVWTGSKMIIFGGKNASHNYLNDTWKLTGGTQWSQIITTNNPLARMGAKSFYDTQSEQMFIFGGDTVGAGYDNKSFVLNLKAGISQNQWTEKTFSNPPPQIHNHAGIYNTKDEIWIYGGRKSDRTKISNKYKLKFLNPPAAPALNSVTSSCIANSNPDNFISWNDNSDNEDSFSIYKKETPFTVSPINPTEGIPVLSSFKNTNFIKSPPPLIRGDTDPIQNTAYYYRVKAENAAGWSLSGESSVNTTYCGPTANPQSVTTAEDTPLSIALTGSDFESKTLTFTLVANSGPSHGTLTGAIPSFTYTPNSDYNGTDEFKFTVTDSTLAVSASAAISINITPVNDAPILNSIGNKTITEESALTFTISATDPEGQTLTYSASGLPTGATFNTETKTFSWTPTIEQGNSKPTIYTSITFQVSDGVSADSETIQITVNNKNQAPTANKQSVSVLKNTPIDITLVGTDPDGDTLTYTPSDPPNGDLTATDPPSNLFTFTPKTDYTGNNADFTFSVNDGLVDSNNAIIDITITAANQAPTASDQSVSTPKNTAKTITLIATDADGNPLTFSTVTGPLHGALSNASGANITYTPTTEYTGPDSFTFKANDGIIDSNTATVSITVTATEVQLPATPSNLAGAPSCEGSNDPKIILTWTDNSDNETGFKLHRAITSDFTPTTDNKIADIAINITTYSDSTPSPSAIYYYKINAVNAAGGSNYTSSPSITTNSCAPTFVLDPASASISISGTKQFNGYYDTDGPGGSSPNTSIPGSSINSWSSSNTSIASINTSGLATGVSVGSATISGTYSDITATALLTITAGPIANVSIKASDGLTDTDRELIGATFYANVSNSTAPPGKTLNNIDFCADNTPSNNTCDNSWTSFKWDQTNGDWEARTALKLIGFTRLGTWAVYVKVQDNLNFWSDIAKDTFQITFLLGGITQCPADYKARADLSWTKPSQAETDTTGIQIFRKTGLDGTYTQIGQDLANTIDSYQDTTVALSTSYYYKVRYLRTSEGIADNIDSTEINIITGGCPPGPPPPPPPPPSNLNLNIIPINYTANPTDPTHYKIQFMPTNFSFPVEVYIKDIAVSKDGSINDITRGLTKDLVSYSDKILIAPENGIYSDIYFGIKGNNDNSRGYLFSIIIAVQRTFGSQLDSEYIYFYVNQKPNAYFHATTPISGDAPLTVTFKDGKSDGTPSDGGKDEKKIWWADGKDIVLHLGNLNGNKTADGNEAWDHCYSTIINCKNIVVEEFPDSFNSNSWNFTYTETAQAKYCVFDNLMLKPGALPELSMGCADPIDIFVIPKPIAENQNITVEKNTIDNLIELNGTNPANPKFDEYYFKITKLPDNGILKYLGVTLKDCSKKNPCELNELEKIKTAKIYFTPNESYLGNDSFDFIVNNGEQDSDKGIVSIAVIEKKLNEAPVAEASFLLGNERNCNPYNELSGNVCSYTNPLIVNIGEIIIINSFNAHIDVNGDGKASYDPNDWGDITNGVSNGGKCEWDKDFNGPYDETINNPPLPADCSLNGSFNVTFNDKSLDQTNGDPFTILRITDRGGLSGDSAVRVLVRPTEPPSFNPNLIISSGPIVNSINPVAGDSISFKGTVQNIGNKDVIITFKNRFRIDINNDGNPENDITLPLVDIVNGLTKNESKEITSDNWTAIEGEHRIVLCADEPNNDINESNESDNCSPVNGVVGVIVIDPPCFDDTGCDRIGDEFCVDESNYYKCGNFDADPCIDRSLNSCGENETCVEKNKKVNCLLLPIISFSANPLSIKKGKKSTLTWDTRNIIPANGDTCTASNSENYAEWQGNVNPNGNKDVYPAKTTRYTLICENSLKKVSESVIIRVQSKPPIEI